MISIYPSTLEGEPLETHPHRETSLLAWLGENIGADFDPDRRLLLVTVNGVEVDDLSCVVRASDDVRIHPLPKNDTFNLFFNPAFHSKVGIMKYLMPKVKTPNLPNQQRGAGLQENTVSGNQPKLNGIIREVAGRHRVYPDFLLPAHRYFGTPRDQWVELLLCVGKGKFDIPTSRVKIGDTPIISLGENADFRIYQPGASLAAETAAQWWHSAPEVGSTSTGTPGLELRSTTTVPPTPTAESFVFDEFTVSIPAGAGSFPAGWTAGMIVRIAPAQTYAVTSTTIQGDMTALQPFVGMQIEIVGANSGFYEIASFDGVDTISLRFPGGADVTGLTGTDMAIGYAGLRYRITAANTQTIAVDRLTDTGATDLDWPGWPAFSTSAALITLDESTREGDWIGPFSACPDGEVTSEIEHDVLFSNGLFTMNKYGNAVPYAVTVELQYRDRDVAGAWTSIRKTYSLGTLDAAGFTERTVLSSTMRPEVRMRRIGARSSDTNTQDAVQWYGLRARLAVKTSYEGVTVLAVRVKGGERLSNQSDSLINVEATRVLPVRNGLGGWDVETPTRGIVPWVAHVARSTGYSDAEVDFAELDALGQVWAARGDLYDFTHESATTAKEAINKALRSGFAELTLERGRISAARDEPRTVFEEMYTPQNMTKGLVRSVDLIQPDDYDGVDVQYVSGETWQVETVPCRLPGDEGRKVLKVQADGITDVVRAWRFGMRRRRELAYRRWNLTWSTELDALNSRYLSFVSVSSDIPGYQQSALLVDFLAGNGRVLLESSEPLIWTEAAIHMVAIRKPDGTLSGPYVATRIDDFRLTVQSLDFVPDVSWKIEPPHLQFGPATRWCYPSLITDVKPSGTSSVNVSAENYDERVYADDDAFPPMA